VRNFALLALQQVIIRIGWIFRTESVIIPAFIDSIAGPAWVRGFIPVVSRFGQAVPGFLLSARLQAAPRKKDLLGAACIAMGLSWLVIAWTTGAAGVLGSWPVFLLLYGVSWCFSGLNQVLYGTVQGKLIPAGRRGRLITAGVFGGVVPAVAFAWWLLPGWLEGEPAFARIFLFSGVSFVLAGLFVLALREPPDERPTTRRAPMLRSAWDLLRSRPAYRDTVIVAAIFSSSIMVFPHYQALARERFALEGVHWMTWVVVQNLSMGAASLVIGPAADRLGNRLVLRIVIFASAGIPLFAVALTFLTPDLARSLFLWVFVGIGLIPIGFRVVVNYLLEISPSEDHAQCLALSQMCTAATFVLSPLVGLSIDWTSFEAVFVGQAGLLLVGGLLTFRLIEPRRLS
jgi:predicted MFS family arabinose efflux permease